MRAKLTSRTLAALTPKDTPYEVFDLDIKGFLLRVEPSGTKTYYLAYTTPSGRRGRYRIGRSGNLSPVQARDVAVRLTAEVAHGRDVHADKVQARREAELAQARGLGVFLETVFASWFRAHQSARTDTVRKVRKAFPELLAKPMGDITSWCLEKWRTQKLKGGISALTVNREIAALRGVLSKAVEWGYLDRHPLPRGTVKQIKTDNQGKVRYLNADEERRLRETLERRENRIRSERQSANTWRQQRGYAALPDLSRVTYSDHLKPMVLLSLNTGLRRGEVLSLTWVNVNFHTQMLTVEGRTAKSRKTRHVPLNAEVLEVLRRWSDQTGGEGLVFPGKDGKPLDNVQTSWVGLLKAAGIAEFRWHDLRHSFASKLVMAGVDLNTVRELLGHSDIKMTLRYAHLAPEHKHEAVARLASGAPQYDNPSVKIRSRFVQ